MQNKRAPSFQADPGCTQSLHRMGRFRWLYLNYVARLIIRSVLPPVFGGNAWRMVWKANGVCRKQVHHQQGPKRSAERVDVSGWMGWEGADCVIHEKGVYLWVKHLHTLACAFNVTPDVYVCIDGTNNTFPRPCSAHKLRMPKVVHFPSYESSNERYKQQFIWLFLVNGALFMGCKQLF